MLVNHERRLLIRAAETLGHRIAVCRQANASWPGDHSRLLALESTGHLRRVDHCEDSEGTVAVWQITPAGLVQLQMLTSGAH
ncbi:hypothetical protein MCBMB27_02429 [Methylobacterium phyllosphaerae]|uniref:Uncharacterized protein n=1 Tax=Methylobacterium phyllosphaerae TaxID=418223 RepID=A0AAE8HTK3_9HYPH|nr:hypothetical protein MCBMB27_02429 [Methylobacterium phyllosphaerae]SFH14843.1 hypothetical protein SAMN05192567_11521 [Methylobacterium phyllosphaerae]